MFPANTRILVVEDHLPTRATIKNHLRGMGFTFIIDAENGARAHDLLMQARDCGEPFQLVLSDWEMPEMTGIELLRKVRAVPELKNLPFLLLATEGAAEQVREAISAGVSYFIVKPFQPTTLSEKILATWMKHNPA